MISGEMLMEKEAEEQTVEIKLELKARTSKIKGQKGLVRINMAHIDETDFEKGDNVELCTPDREGKGIIVKVIADKYILKGIASIRKEDMDRLKIKDEDPIILKTYKKYSDTIKEGYQKLKEKLKRKKDEEEEEANEE